MNMSIFLSLIFFGFAFLDSAFRQRVNSTLIISLASSDIGGDVCGLFLSTFVLQEIEEVP